MQKESNLTAACERGGDLNRVAVFAYLREAWLAKKKGRTLGELCDFLEINKQMSSSYATGSDGRRPPWWVLLRMLAGLGLEIRITMDGACIGKHRPPRRSEHFIPHTFDGEDVIPDGHDVVVG